MRYKLIVIAMMLPLAWGCNQKKWTIESHPTYNLIEQRGGQRLGYWPQSGVEIIEQDGFAFKDMNRNGVVDCYEDWRNSAYDRAQSLAKELSIEQIAGLMLYSSHQAVPTDSVGFWSSTYNGTTIPRSGLRNSAISDKQRKFLTEDNLRAVLVVKVESPEISAEWSNNMQALAEGLGCGIPVNISSDPRHETKAWAEYNAGSGGKISLWPGPIGLAATFDPELVKEFGRIASIEYRALGIATALSPQIDLATEPRWNRFYGTFGEDVDLDTDMARAYVDGMQSSDQSNEITDGWGYQSVNAMVKHWPGGGPEEGGRDAHYSFGKFTVYPGKNIDEHIKPFVDGAFKLHGKTKKAAAVMPYYTISYGIDPSGRNVGNSYSKYIITDLLRNKYQYDGVVCTDWAITHDYNSIEQADGKCWGMENQSITDRHYSALIAGVDQFGGNNDKAPILEAYKRWCAEFGKQSARERFELSARRLLLNIFRTGLFENPYVDPKASTEIVGNSEYMNAGYQAQLKSIIMLKNRGNVLPVKWRRRVYISGLEAEDKSLDSSLASEYFEVTQDPKNAEMAIVFINEPKTGTGYDKKDRNNGGNGYVPISLQYNDYKAIHARTKSIAGGDPKEESKNRSYAGKSVKCSNKNDLDRVLATRKAMGNKPIVVVVSVTKPMVVGEFEPSAEAILLTFGVQHQAVMDIISGRAEPSALLPMQLPADMRTVELQNEDCARDMTAHRDTEGRVYDFAYGLNWKGVIDDRRVAQYK